MSGQIRWPGDEDGIAHPDDSILLAYIRQQSLGKHGPDIYQHIAHCEKCQQRCNELRQPGKILEEALQSNALLALQKDIAWDWLDNPAAAQDAFKRRQHERLQEDLALGMALLTHVQLLLLALVAQVGTALFPDKRKGKPASQRRGLLGPGFIPLSGGLAVFFLILALTAIVVFATMTGNIQPFHLPSGINPAPPQPNVVVLPHPTPTPVVEPGTGGTLTPGESIPTIFVCNDKKSHHFDICGKNFKPNARVVLVVQFADGSSKLLHPTSTDQSGNFQETWPNTSCKNMPMTIFVSNLTNISVDSGAIQNILNGKCSSNTQQRAGHH